MPEFTHAIVLAGSPESNLSLYHRIRFAVGDPTASIDLVRADGSSERVLMIRDIEMDRARTHARADRVICPADHKPDTWHEGDRELATAQSLAQCLLDHGIERVVVDRTLPEVYAHYMRERGIGVECDPMLGIMERRAKDEQELDALRDAQRLTEGCMRYVCELIASAKPDKDGILQHDGAPLTSERIFPLIDLWFMERGASSPHGAIVAAGPVGGDCHDRGRGPIRTGEPVIIDLFPHVKATRYHGDCTRCIVHGDIPDEVARMHACVLEAQDAAIHAIRTGVTADAVHAATIGVITKHGYHAGIPDDPDTIAMVHGTGHGIGLDVHEPPLIDVGGVELVRGDVLTIEPGLYSTRIGGIRIEDMVAVTDDGCENFNTLHKGLSWS